MACLPFCLCFCSFINTFSFHNLCLKLFLFRQKWLNTCWTCSPIQKIPSLHTMSSVLNVTRISVFLFYRIYCKCDISAYFPSKTWASYSEQKKQVLFTHCIHFQELMSIYWYCFFFILEENYVHVISLPAGQSRVRKRQEKGIHLFSKMPRLALVPPSFGWFQGILSRK